MASAAILLVFAMALAGWIATSGATRWRELPYVQLSTLDTPHRLAAYLGRPILFPLATWLLTLGTLAVWLRPNSDLTAGNIAYIAGTLVLCIASSLVGAAVGARRSDAVWGVGVAFGTLAVTWVLALPSGGWAAAVSPSHAEFLSAMFPARPMWATGKLLMSTAAALLAGGLGFSAWLPATRRRRWTAHTGIAAALVLVPAVVLVGLNGTKLQGRRPPDYRCAGRPSICIDVANVGELPQLAEAFAAMAERSNFTLVARDQTLYEQPPHNFQTQREGDLFDYSGTAPEYRLPGWSTAEYTVLGYLQRLTWERAACSEMENQDTQTAVAEWLASGFDGPQWESSPVAQRYKAIPTDTAAVWFATVKDAWLDCELAPAQIPVG